MSRARPEVFRKWGGIWRGREGDGLGACISFPYFPTLSAKYYMHQRILPLATAASRTRLALCHSEHGAKHYQGCLDPASIPDHFQGSMCYRGWSSEFRIDEQSEIELESQSLHVSSSSLMHRPANTGTGSIEGDGGRAGRNGDGGLYAASR